MLSTYGKTDARKLNFSMPDETLAAYVKRHRIKVGLKQEALAQLAGISQSYVSGIERGVNVEVDAKILVALPVPLKVSPSEISAVGRRGMGFVDHGELTRIPDDTAILIDAYNGASPQNKELLRTMAEKIREMDSDHSIGGRNRRDD